MSAGRSWRGRRRRWAAALIASARLLAGSAAVAEPPPPEGPDPVQVPADPVALPVALGPAPAPEVWRPPPFDPKADDWIRLVSGEWVKGEIELIEDETVTFDSDVLDDLELDWEDVAEIRSPRRNTYRFEGRQIVSGTSALVGGVLRIDTGQGVVEYPRSSLVSMIGGEPRERDYWSAELSLGFALRSGNTDQRDITSYAQLERRTALTRLLAEYRAAFSELEGDTTAENERASGRFDLFVTRHLYLTAPYIEAYRDRFQNIDLRLTPAAGVGYEIIDRSWVEWTVGGLGGYQYTVYDSVEPGDPDAEDDAAVLLSTGLELDPTGDIEWDNSYRLQLVVTDLGKTSHHFESVVSLDLWGPLDLDVGFTWDRIEDPRQDDAGETPEKDDFRLTVGLGIDF